MSRPIFGLSTTPIADIRSDLQQQIARDLLRIYLARPRKVTP